MIKLDKNSLAMDFQKIWIWDKIPEKNTLSGPTHFQE